MHFARALVLAVAGFAALSSCSWVEGEDDADIALIGEAGEVEYTGLRLSPAGQLLKQATAEGLVAFDANGDVVPAVAERWIVTDDGLSYIFRLRDSNWPDGAPLSAEGVASRLRQTIERLQGTSLGYDLAVIDDIRAMAGRVIEIRLEYPSPEFMRLLAQPELGLMQGEAGLGPMRAQGEEGTYVLQAVPPEERGLPMIEEWEETVRPVTFAVLPADEAIAGFDDGAFDVVLNGRLQDLLLVDTGPLSRGTIRIDPVAGLFGLSVTRPTGLLSEPLQREAVAMAIDRASIGQAFNIGGWAPSTRIVPELGDLADGPLPERWAGLTIDQRRAEAARRIALWQSASGEPARITVFLPQGPGSDRLFTALASDLDAVGVSLARVENVANAQLVLLDRVARYRDRRWFLNQFNCRVRRIGCSRETDLLVAASLRAETGAERQRLQIEAESILLDENLYIPLGPPIRWSLVRGGVDAFEPSPSGLHPLFPFARRPI
ncbi:ABC transporter substrate-binding protein [Erythrobacter sp. HKB08]|uniref:ABC transporter substrate-binding protein n=1 Tax=Erythrobacter sp. HKB08 TaxID=2502843 RepID=UPI001008BA74|nr:ABC transporter substrate-binding protein [Erythrobacter sp. HKB08]